MSRQYIQVNFNECRQHIFLLKSKHIYPELSPITYLIWSISIFLQGQEVEESALGPTVAVDDLVPR